MICGHCNDTGSLSKSVHGHLDCPHCDATEERLALEDWATPFRHHDISALLWLVYQRGKQAEQINQLKEEPHDTRRITATNT